MPSSRTHSIVAIEAARLEQLRQADPAALEHSGSYTTHQLEEQIGLTALPKDVPTGFLRYRPEDFIVEELDSQHRVVPVDPEPLQLTNQSNHQSLYCHLVKVGLDTFEALERVADALGIPVESISFAGLKDARAITAQRISFKNISIEQLQRINVPQVFLKHAWTGKGKLYRGVDLIGNRFTITIRPADPLDRQIIATKIEKLKQGFINYYGGQRFGRRQLSHYFGKLVCQGKFQTAVEEYFTTTHPIVRNYEAAIRTAAKEHLGDWAAIRASMVPYPYTFAFDLTMIDYLAAHPGDWTGALLSIMEQTKLWVHAYMSYLVNMSLSTYAAEGLKPPPVVPIPLSSEERDREPYRDFLEQDQIPFDFPSLFTALPFLTTRPRTLDTWVIPTIHGWEITPVGLVISFDLPTGAYATTALRQLFILETDDQAPAWVPTDPIDPKTILKTGSVEPLRQIFGSAMEPRSITDVTAIE